MALRPAAVITAAIATLVARSTHAQSERESFRCALLGAERAADCLRQNAAQSSARDIERAVSLWISSGDLQRAAQEVDSASSNIRAGGFAAMLAIGRAHHERRDDRAALDWYTRWRDRAKHEGTADVLAAVDTGIGHALFALGRTREAYEAYRLAVHVWRTEHAYKLADDGTVLNEYEGTLGYVAPPLLTFLQQRPPSESLLRSAPATIVDPFGGLAQPDHERRPHHAHRTRSRLDERSFERGNRASGEALLGMLRIQHDAFVREEVPQYRGRPTPEAYERWTRRVMNPRLAGARWTFEFTIVLLAQHAMATGVTAVELGAAQQLAHTHEQFARWIRAIPLPAEWSRPGEPWETMIAQD